MRVSVSRAIYDGPRDEQAGANPPGICGSLCRVGSTFVAIRYVTQLLHPAFVSGLRYVVAGAASMAYLRLRRRLVRRPAKFPVDVQACLMILYLALFGSLAGYASYMFLLQNVRLSTAATYAYINPVVAILLGWWLLQETPHGTEWVGMVIVLVSVAAVIASRPPAGKAVAELEGPIQEISRMDQSSKTRFQSGALLPRQGTIAD